MYSRKQENAMILHRQRLLHVNSYPLDDGYYPLPLLHSLENIRSASIFGNTPHIATHRLVELNLAVGKVA